MTNKGRQFDPQKSSRIKNTQNHEFEQCRRKSYSILSNNKYYLKREEEEGKRNKENIDEKKDK